MLYSLKKAEDDAKVDVRRNFFQKSISFRLSMNSLLYWNYRLSIKYKFSSITVNNKYKNLKRFGKILKQNLRILFEITRNEIVVKTLGYRSYAIYRACLTRTRLINRTIRFSEIPFQTRAKKREAKKRL